MTHRLLRKVKANLLRFNQEHRPVLIMGLRRGGTTMVADAVSSNKGVWYADEPYAMFPKRPGFTRKSARLFVPKHSNFFDLSPGQLAKFDSFAKDLLQARFRDMGTARHTLPGWRANRICLKILNAPWMLPWFVQNADAHILALVRHPGAQARSVMRQNWGYAVEAYLERPALLEQVFQADQMAEARRLWATEDPWVRAILDWVVCSYPLRKAEGPGVHACRYEQIVAEPEVFINDVLVEKCGLQDRAAMKTALLRPSGSSHLNTHAATESIAQRDVDKILNGWRYKCSDQELKTGQEIMDIFGVTSYSFDA